MNIANELSKFKKSDLAYLAGNGSTSEIKLIAQGYLVNHPDATVADLGLLLHTACNEDIASTAGKKILKHPELTKEDLCYLSTHKENLYLTLDAFNALLSHPNLCSSDLKMVLLRCSNLNIINKAFDVFLQHSSTSMDDLMEFESKKMGLEARIKLENAILQHPKHSKSELRYLTCGGSENMENVIKAGLMLLDRPDITIHDLMVLIQHSHSKRVSTNALNILLAHPNVSTLTLYNISRDTLFNMECRVRVKKALLKHPNVSTEHLVYLITDSYDESIIDEAINALLVHPNLSIQDLKKLPRCRSIKDLSQITQLLNTPYYQSLQALCIDDA